MALTDENLVEERAHFGDGVQRVYRVGRYGLSLVNAPMLHNYPFAWEAAVTDYGTPDGAAWKLTYATPLSSDVEVFSTEDEAAAFLAKAFDWFAEQAASPSAA